MNSLHIHIEEELDTYHIRALMASLMSMPHVRDVEYSSKAPHEMFVDVDEHCNMPVAVLERLEREGLHPDLVFL